MSVFFYFLKEKIIFKSYLKKSDYRVLRNNRVDTYGAPDFAPHFSTTG
jgi:hypothetical protein